MLQRLISCSAVVEDSLVCKVSQAEPSATRLVTELHEISFSIGCLLQLISSVFRLFVFLLFCLMDNNTLNKLDKVDNLEVPFS